MAPVAARSMTRSRSSRRPERIPRIVSSLREAGVRSAPGTGPYAAATYTPRGPRASRAHGQDLRSAGSVDDAVGCLRYRGRRRADVMAHAAIEARRASLVCTTMTRTSGGAEHLGGKQAERSAAHDDREAAGLEGGHPHAVRRGRASVDEGRDRFVGDPIRDADDLAGRDDHPLREAASSSLDPDDRHEVRAQALVACPAHRAGAVAGEVGHRDALPDPLGIFGRAGADDASHRLMAEDERQVRAVGASLEDVQVGATDAARETASSSSFGPAHRILDLGDLQVLGRDRGEERGAHIGQVRSRCAARRSTKSAVLVHVVRTASAGTGQPKRSQLAAIGLAGHPRADRIEIEHALTGREVQLRRDAYRCRSSGCGRSPSTHVVVEEPTDVAAERDTRSGRSRSRCLRPDGAQGRTELREGPVLSANVNGWSSHEIRWRIGEPAAASGRLDDIATACLQARRTSAGLATRPSQMRMRGGAHGGRPAQVWQSHRSGGAIERVGSAERIERRVADDIEGRDDEAGAAHDSRRPRRRAPRRPARPACPAPIWLPCTSIASKPSSLTVGRGLDVVAPPSRRHADELAVIGLA